MMDDESKDLEAHVRTCSPSMSFDHQLSMNLHTRLASTFAGLILGDDGTLQVYVTTHEPLLDEITRSTEQATSSSHAPIKIIVGSKNTLADLNHLIEVITSRHEEFITRGILVTQYSPNVWINKVGIGVKDLTPTIKTFLEHEFGVDRVAVFEQGVHVAPIGVSANEVWVKSPS